MFELKNGSFVTKFKIKDDTTDDMYWVSDGGISRKLVTDWKKIRKDQLMAQYKASKGKATPAHEKFPDDIVDAVDNPTTTPSKYTRGPGRKSATICVDMEDDVVRKIARAVVEELRMHEGKRTDM